MNVLSLFDGMSCGQIALNRINKLVTRYYASEIDKYAIKITQKNFPNTIQLGNVCDIDAELLPEIDLLLGGSPCQSFSFAGKGAGFEGESRLFWEFVRLLKAKRPRYFLLENVVMKKSWERVISEAVGVTPIKINSALVSAQNRERLYWTNIPILTPIEDKNIQLSTILEHFNFTREPYQERYKCNIPILYTKPKFHTLRAQAGSRTCGRGICDKSGWWRQLTPLECERLQTVPEGYTEGVSNTQRYKMLGNGWTIDIISNILKGMS